MGTGIECLTIRCNTPLVSTRHLGLDPFAPLPEFSLYGYEGFWGQNNYGQSQPLDDEFSYVSAGGRHSCGLRLDSTAECWGRNEYGESDSPSEAFSRRHNDGFGSSCRRDTTTRRCDHVTTVYIGDHRVDDYTTSVVNFSGRHSVMGDDL